MLALAGSLRGPSRAVVIATALVLFPYTVQDHIKSLVREDRSVLTPGARRRRVPRRLHAQARAADAAHAQRQLRRTIATRRCHAHRSCPRQESNLDLPLRRRVWMHHRIPLKELVFWRFY